MDIILKLNSVSFANNTLYDYFLAFVIFLALILALKIFQVIILSRLYKIAKKTKTDFDDVLIEIFKSIKPPFYFFLAVYFSIKSLKFPELVDKTIFILFIILIVFQIIRSIERLLDYFINKFLQKSESKGKSKEHSRAMIKTLQVIFRIILWTLGLLLILSNLGVNVNSLIASLGIGGIAVALALQGVLSDVFSSFSLYIDKPFEVGDYIVIGTDTGTVEKIGLKTTRIKTLQGEELVISNQELTSARIQNYRKMKERRIVFNLGVVYNTPVTKLKSIPKLVKEIIKKEKLAKFDRCYFTEFNDSSLNFEIVMYINSPEYEDYLKTRHKINLDIYKTFEKEGIVFAYPTQTLYINKE